MDAKILILGAGCAGLAAASELLGQGQDVLILEGQKRVGGRIHTFHSSAVSEPIELGAEFIHGIHPEIETLLVKGHLATRPMPEDSFVLSPGAIQSNKDFWQQLSSYLEPLYKNPDPQQAVAAYFKRHPSPVQTMARQYVEGFHAADVQWMSQSALALEENGAGEDSHHNRRLTNGYDALVTSLFQLRPEMTVRLRLGRIVREIHWDEPNCTVVCDCGGKREVFTAEKVLVTFPLGVLKSGSVRFFPELNDRRLLFASVHMGAALRVVVLLDSPLWESRLPKTGGFLRHPTADTFPAWWADPIGGHARLTGWVGGPAATRLGGFADEQVFNLALEDMATLLEVPSKKLMGHLISWHFHNWQTDPFALGAYSYLGINGIENARKLFAPLKNTVFFAGEAALEGPGRGTVHAALRTGIAAAKAMQST
jgi:monoamine oxidase